MDGPEPSPLHALVVASPELTIRGAALPVAGLPATDRQRAGDALESLGLSDDAAFVDPRSGRWATLLPSTQLLPGAGNELRWGTDRPQSPAALRRHAWQAFAEWLAARADALGVDGLGIAPAEVAAPGKVTVSRDGDLIHLFAAREVDGRRVRGSHLTAVVSHGNLVLFGAVRWGDVSSLDDPRLDAAGARRVVDRHLGPLAGRIDWNRSELVVLPLARGADPRAVPLGAGYGHRLAWSFYGVSPDGWAAWEALVDAHDGSLLAFVDRTHAAASAGPSTRGGASRRSVVGGAFPVSNDGDLPDGVEALTGMPFAQVETDGGLVVTDRGGNVGACVDGPITTALEGRHVSIDDQCGALSESTTDEVLDLGLSVGTDCAVPVGASAGNTPAARTAFVELNRLMAIGRGYLPASPFLVGDVTARTNFNFSCGASAAGTTLTFGRSGSGCANTGEIAGVIAHEWGHAVDLADAVPGVSSPSEGIADLYAAHSLHVSCIGRGFFTTGATCSGYGDPCTQCDGVRDIDWTRRASGQPHTVAWADANCAGAPSNGPCGGIDHCEGAVVSEAVWDLWHRDLPAAPYSYDARRAAELTALLTWHGAGNVDRWFTCTQGAAGDGCHADGGYLNYLAADDDDGDLTNGTPHMGAIFAAFDRHGIACTTPVVQDAGCVGAPTEAPAVVATPLARGVGLTWDAVPGASSYRVYRTEGPRGCDFGKELVAEVTEPSVFDRGLRAGADLHYTVIPVGPATSCYGPASPCVAVQPSATGVELALPPQDPLVVIETGDGDAFVDSCEQATASFTVENLGDTATAVRIVGVRSPSHPHLATLVTTPSPIAATLDSCAQVAGSFVFRAFGIEHDDTILFEVDVTSDELAPQVVTQSYAIRFVESDWQAFASITVGFETGMNGWTVEEGLFARTDAFGGGQATSFALASSNGVESACDRARSPVFIPSASTRLSLWTETNMESGDWDRANVAVVSVADGSRLVLEPEIGRLYNVADNPDFVGCNAGEDGWGDVLAWDGSGWDFGVFASTGHVGEMVQLQATHATDAAVTGNGFRIDQISLNDVEYQVPDGQADCDSPLFADGFESGDLGRWSHSGP
ncbi:MAG: hypothetical protein AAGC60_19120 [Acidobacteriota bacterium]